MRPPITGSRVSLPQGRGMEAALNKSPSGRGRGIQVSPHVATALQRALREEGEVPLAQRWKVGRDALLRAAARQCVRRKTLDAICRGLGLSAPVTDGVDRRPADSGTVGGGR